MRRLNPRGIDATGYVGDGAQFLADDGSWKKPPAGGGGGSGVVVSPPVMVARTAGSYTLATGGYVDVDTALDLVIPAAAGDWVVVGLSSGLNGGATKALDMVTMVAGAPVTYLSGAGSAGLGVQAWASSSSSVTPIGGAITYQVKAGDVENGNVRLRLRSKTAGGGTLFAQSDRPLVLWAWNMSAGDTGPTSTAVEVSDYGTDGAAMVAAANAAGAGGTIHLAKTGGHYTIAAPITLTDVAIASDGATIQVTSAVTSDAITIDSPADTSRIIRCGGFYLTGPGVRTLGTKTAGGANGIAVTNYAKVHFHDMQTTLFDEGLAYDNLVGHIYCTRVVASDNYYGVYLRRNNNDYRFTDCLINGNTFANLGCPADQGWGGLILDGGHFGFAPYGIYQEAAPAAQGANKIFLQTFESRGTRFEQIGNAAIWSDATQDASNYSVSGSITMIDPGFSWSTSDVYKIADRPKTHAVQFTQTARIIQIRSGAYPFTSGDGGTSAPIHVKQSGHSAIELIGSTAATTDVKVDAGNTNVFAYARPLAGVISTNGDSVNTQLNVGTATGYFQPAGSTSRRFGGDGSYLYADINNDLRFRNSGASYGLIGRIRTSDIIMPKYALGAAGASGGPSWSQGTGAPTAAEPNGSIYSRTDGAAGSTLYSRVAGAWVAIA